MTNSLASEESVRVGQISPPASQNRSSDIIYRMDRLPVTRRHLSVLLICAIGFGFDLLEISLGNILSAVFSVPPHEISTRQLSLLLAAAYVGAILGAPALGWFADRRGPKCTLTYAVMGLVPLSIALALSRTLPWVIAFRLLTGVALGAYPPLMMAYVSDVLPPARRGTLTMILVAASYLVPPGGIFLIRWLTPLQPLGIDAWRWAFIASGGGLALGAILLYRLPESPRWLLQAGFGPAAETACSFFEQSGALWRPEKSVEPAALQPAQGGSLAPLTQRRYLILGALLQFLSPWGTVAFPLLSGAVLVAKGFKLSDTLLYIGIAAVGPIIGSLAAALFLESVDRRTAVMLCGGLMAVTAVVFAVNSDPLYLIAMSIAFGLCTSLYVPLLSLYIAELFPTGTRSSAAALTWSVNRIGAAIAPLLLLPLLRSQGVSPMIVVIATALVGSILILGIFGPRGMARRALS
jgi:putative MFS transporter